MTDFGKNVVMAELRTLDREMAMLTDCLIVCDFASAQKVCDRIQRARAELAIALAILTNRNV